MATDFVHKDGSGSMFVNQRKTKDNHPDRTGSLMWKGELIRLAGWIKEGKNGNPPWLSISATPSDPPADKPPKDTKGWDDDVPF